MTLQKAKSILKSIQNSIDKTFGKNVVCKDKIITVNSNYEALNLAIKALEIQQQLNDLKLNIEDVKRIKVENEVILEAQKKLANFTTEFKKAEEVPNSWLDRCTDNGYERYTDEEGNRRYVDNNVRTSDMPFRPCARCGHYPNENGDDHCIQNLGRVVNACCGHGTCKGYIMFDDGTIIRGYFEIERQ